MPADKHRAQENWDRYEYARDGGHLDYVKKADVCDRFFAGMQWEESIRKRLERQGKPVITVNETFASMASIMGEQLNNRSDVSFRPKGRGMQGTADALSKLWLHFASHYKLDWLESEVAADGFITSRGFYDIRMNFDENMRGEIDISQWNPRNVVIDPDAEDYDSDKWKEAFLTKWFTLNDIRRLWGEDPAEELKHKPVSDFAFGYDSIAYVGRMRDNFDGENWMRAMHEDEDDPARRRIRVLERQYRELERVMHFVDKVTGETRVVPPTWERERYERVAAQADLALVKRQTEVIRWLVTADTLVLHDEISPYKHLTVVPYFPFFRRGTTIGLVEHILSPQEMLNKTLSQELHVVNTTANSGYKVKKGALQNMDAEELQERGAETGIVIELDDIANLEKITGNAVPTGLDRLTFKASEYAKRVMNVPDTLRGFDREDVAAKAIAQKKVNSNSSFAKPLDNLNRTRHMVARNTIDLAQTFYTEERVFMIAARDLGAQSEELVVNSVDPETGAVANDLTVGEFEAVVTTVPPRDTFQQQQFAEVLQLRQLGVGIPDDILVEQSTLSRKDEIVKRMRGGDSAEAQAQMVAMQAEIQQLDMQLKRAEILKKTADARLAEARARAQMNESGDPNMDAEIILKREEMAANLALKEKQLEEELRLKREELAMKERMASKELLLKRAQADADLELKEKEADDRAAVAATDVASRHQIESKRVDFESKLKERDQKTKEKVADRSMKLKAKSADRDYKLKSKVADGNQKLKAKQIAAKGKSDGKQKRASNR